MLLDLVNAPGPLLNDPPPDPPPDRNNGDKTPEAKGAQSTKPSS